MGLKPPEDRTWTREDAAETYGVAAWGGGYFSVNDQGNVAVSCDNGGVDLRTLVEDVTAGGVQLPMLFRFTDLLGARIRLLNGAFNQAIERYGYAGQYRGVYPIKVNQSRKIVEAVTKFGRAFHYGLEAGSKPELLAVTAMLEDEDALVICNGYKDVHYVETALLASKLGRTVIICIENPTEFAVVAAAARRLGVKPTLGIRLKVSSRGAGKWEQSSGDHAKFGLSVEEIVTVVEHLRESGHLDWLQLLHFHIGSQITAIRSVKDALREASRTYTELAKMGCSSLRYFDAGGGLGVDYDGSQTNFDSSMNYSMQEYANDVVSAVQEACDEAGFPHPTLVTESGRAIAAHHSVLVFDVIGVTVAANDAQLEPPVEEGPQIAKDLWEVLETVELETVRECYHDAQEYKDRVLGLYNTGQLSLTERAYCETIFWTACQRMARVVGELTRVPDELRRLERMLSDTYFCNFSVFQSVPDAWAVDQLFPVMPIHRLLERPDRRGVLADITCDSDGMLNSFISPREVKRTLELHAFTGEPYYLGVFLTGAYQEILGDMHNLFGDTNVVHVSFDEDGSHQVDGISQGDSVSDVLAHVDYSAEELVSRLQQNTERAVRRGTMTVDESRELMKRYRDGLDSYTYLD